MYNDFTVEKYAALLISLCDKMCNTEDGKFVSHFNLEWG